MRNAAVVVPGVVAMLVASGRVARADDEAPTLRPLHGSLGVGGGLRFGGADRWSGAAALDVLPGGGVGTWGVSVGVRDVGYSPFAHHGAATIGVIREAAAARPLLAILVHGDVGVAWGEGDGDKTVPVVGGGLKTYLAIVGPLGVALDTTLDLEINGVDDTHFVLGFGLMAAVIR
jgi:hypothetical protein